MSAVPTASRLHPSDLLRVGSIGLRTRRLRAALSALGIAIGIAAMVAVLGISESSKADVLSVLDRLGTNLLTVEASAGIGGGDDAELPATGEAMIGRVGPVQDVASVTSVEASVYRTDLVPEAETGGITVRAADVELLDTLSGELAQGRFLDPANDEYPAVVLGAVAADRLGIDDVSPPVRVTVGGEWFGVVGILEPMELADIDRSVLIGRPVAAELFDTSTAPGIVYVRTETDQVEEASKVLAQTANPESPDQVTVARPSDAIEAGRPPAPPSRPCSSGSAWSPCWWVGWASPTSWSSRCSNGAARSACAGPIGATRRHITVQFLAEALLLTLLGGTAGVTLGAAITAAYDALRGWEIVVPPVALGGGLAAAVLIWAVAGLYPALRAARLSPTEALRTV